MKRFAFASYLVVLVFGVWAGAQNAASPIISSPPTSGSLSSTPQFGNPAQNLKSSLDPGGHPLEAQEANSVSLPLSPAEVMETAAVAGLPPRDPFRLPEELIIKIRQNNAMNSTGGIDPSIDAIRRFPLASYQLVGIIWDVKKPKAMFMDRLNSIHMVQINDFIGNAKGVVTSIQSGSITVLEGKIPQVIKLKK